MILKFKIFKLLMLSLVCWYYNIPYINR